MNIQKSYDFFKPEKCEGRIHIIGCGAIGSTVAENLVRFGLTNITLYDFDKVEAHNIANQIFTEEDIGKYKTEALSEYLFKINPELKENMKIVNSGYHGQRLSGYVFLCVDSIELRRQIAEQNKDNIFIKGMFDFRMRLTDAQHYAADWSNQKMVKDFINSMAFSHDEALEETPMSACNMVLSVVPTVRLIVALGVSNFVNFVNKKNIKKMIVSDAFSYLIDAF